jgi:hypothetical protein
MRRLAACAPMLRHLECFFMSLPEDGSGKAAPGAADADADAGAASNSAGSSSLRSCIKLEVRVMEAPHASAATAGLAAACPALQELCCVPQLDVASSYAAALPALQDAGSAQDSGSTVSVLRMPEPVAVLVLGCVRAVPHATCLHPPTAKRHSVAVAACSGALPPCVTCTSRT